MSNEHTPLTAAEITELRELEAKATPGPWISEPCHKGESCWCRTIGVVGDEDNYVAPSGCLGTDDAALIVSMRNALPRLLSRIEALEWLVEVYAMLRDKHRPPKWENGYGELLESLEVAKRTAGV